MHAHRITSRSSLSPCHLTVTRRCTMVWMVRRVYGTSHQTRSLVGTRASTVRSRAQNPVSVHSRPCMSPRLTFNKHGRSRSTPKVEHTLAPVGPGTSTYTLHPPTRSGLARPSCRAVETSTVWRANMYVSHYVCVSAWILFGRYTFSDRLLTLFTEPRWQTDSTLVRVWTSLHL